MNRNRVYRWYRFEGLQIRMRVRLRKHMSLHSGPVLQARRTHERWSMDFVQDQLFGGRAFRVLTIVDQFSRQTPLLEPRFSFGGSDVVAALDRAIETIEAWRIDYNEHQSHSSLGHLTPNEYAQKRQEKRASEPAVL